MSDDVKYILKRVLVGVLIFLCISFIKTRKVEALTSNFDSVLMCSTNLGCSTSLALPYSYSYADSARVNFSGINLIQGKSYSINFSMTLTSPSFSFNLDYPQLFVIDSSGTPVRAYPDRAQSLQVNNLGNNNYSVIWNFELDNTGGNFTSAYVIFVFTSNYNQNIYSTIINSSNFLYYDLSDPTGNQDIINNNNNNTQNIINNNNSNTEDIINNQNENTEKEIESQKVCSLIDKNSISETSKYLNANGSIGTDDSNYGITDYISIDKNSTITVLRVRNDSRNLCFYNINKTLISCIKNNTMSANSDLSIPNNASFFRASIKVNEDLPTYNLCKNGNQAIQDFLNNNDTSQANSDAKSFFDNFSIGDDSLSGIITAPIRFLNSLSSTCSPVVLTYRDTDISIPCGTTIFWDRQDVGTFRTFWNILFGGSIIYLLAIKLYKVVHNAFDPDKDNIETVGV